MRSSDAHRHWVRGAENLSSLSLTSFWMVSRDPSEWVDVMRLYETQELACAPKGLNSRVDQPLLRKYSLGIHPWHLPPLDDDANLSQSMIELEAHLKGSPSIHLGECGLDLIRGPDLDIQIKYLEAQLKLAQKYQRKVAVHLVQAYEPLRISLARYPDVRGLIHGYSGSIEWMKQMESQGWYFSFGPEIMDPRRKKSKAAFVASQSFLIESDTHQMSERAWQLFTLEAAQLKGMDQRSFLDISNTRFEELFKE